MDRPSSSRLPYSFGAVFNIPREVPLPPCIFVGRSSADIAAVEQQISTVSRPHQEVLADLSATGCAASVLLLEESALEAALHQHLCESPSQRAQYFSSQVRKQYVLSVWFTAPSTHSPRPDPSVAEPLRPPPPKRLTVNRSCCKLHRSPRLRISANCRRCVRRRGTSEDAQDRQLVLVCPTSASKRICEITSVGANEAS